MAFWRNVSPRGAIGDLINEWRQPNPYRWQILGVSVAATFVLMTLMIPESQRAEPRPPHVTYITTFEANRTEAEIVASNIANQKVKDEVARREAENAEYRKEAAKALGRATGIDVDAMEADIERRKAAEEAAAARQAPAASGD